MPGLRLVAPLLNSIALAAFDSEIYGLCYAAANSIKIICRRQIAQLDLLLICRGDQVSIGVQQLKRDSLIAMVLIDLSIQSRTS